MKSDERLSVLRKFNSFLRKFMRYNPKISSDNVKLQRSSTDDLISVSSYTSSNYSTNYSKKDKSLDLTRNNDNNYEVVLPYQRISKNKKHIGSICHL